MRSTDGAWAHEKDPSAQASNLGFFFLKPKEAISVRLREQAAAAAAQPSGENDDQYGSFAGDGGALAS